MDSNENQAKRFNFGATSRLKDGILLKTLVESNTAEFTLDISENIKDEFDDFELETYDTNDSIPFNNINDSNDALDDVSKTSFDQLREKMSNVVDDGGIKKMILRRGSGEAVPSEAVVIFHYSSYLEMQDIPFDSSYQCNKPLHIQLGIGALYPGFEYSLLSMKLNENSRFLINPKYGFGEMGCPPRIPPNATLLLEIELLKIVDNSEISSVDAPLEEKDSFLKASTRAKEYHVLGNDFYAKEDVFSALNKYKKAENILLSCKMCSDEEESLCRKLLFKIYTNMCVCYNHPRFNSPERVCLAAKEAFYIHPKKAEKSAKIYFHLGKAQLAFQEFEKANKYLQKALSLEPGNKDIRSLITELEKKRNKYHQHEKLTYQKAFDFQKPVSKNVEPNINFEETFREEVEEILKKHINQIQLPPSLTSKEKQLCQEISEEHGLFYEEQMIGGKQTTSVRTKD